MDKKYRIEENELLSSNHYPVKVLFDMVSDTRFEKVLYGLCNKQGFGENYGACVFWDDLDDYDKTNTDFYEGAEFGLNNGDEVIISLKELLYYLNIVSNKYSEEYGNKDYIQKWIEQFKISNKLG